MKLGIVGSGAIVSYTVPFLRKNGIEVKALWCRDVELDRGQKYCEEYDISRLYTDYDVFLKDDSYGVVYIGLINSLHYLYARKALEAGKHVICEKPFTSTGCEARKLAELAKEKHLMIFECVMPRFSQNLVVIKENLDKIGQIRLVQSAYSQYSSRYDKYLEKVVLPAFDPDLSGGAMYDIGVYCISFVTELFGIPDDHHYCANIGYNGIDTSGQLSMDYGSFKAVCTAAKDSNGFSGFCIQGEKGYICSQNQPGDLKEIYLVLNKEEPVKLDVIEYEDCREYMFQALNKLIENRDYDKCYQLLENSVKTMKLMEQARKSLGIIFAADQRKEEE